MSVEYIVSYTRVYCHTIIAKEVIKRKFTLSSSQFVATLFRAGEFRVGNEAVFISVLHLEYFLDETLDGGFATDARTGVASLGGGRQVHLHLLARQMQIGVDVDDAEDVRRRLALDQFHFDDVSSRRRRRKGLCFHVVYHGG